MTADDLPFTVEEWTADETARVEVLARTGNLLIARAAFEAAARLRPTRTILCRDGARVVARHTPRPAGDEEARQGRQDGRR